MYHKGRGPNRNGERNGSTKLSAEQAIDIFNSAESAKVLAATHSVSVWCIYQIRQGKTWTHVTQA